MRRDIVEKREEIVDDVNRLESMLRRRYESATDWRQIVRGRPLTIVGVGLALGLLLGLLVGLFTRR